MLPFHTLFPVPPSFLPCFSALPPILSHLGRKLLVVMDPCMPKPPENPKTFLVHRCSNMRIRVVIISTQVLFLLLFLRPNNTNCDSGFELFWDNQGHAKNVFTLCTPLVLDVIHYNCGHLFVYMCVCRWWYQHVLAINVNKNLQEITVVFLAGHTPWSAVHVGTMHVLYMYVMFNAFWQFP